MFWGYRAAPCPHSPANPIMPKSSSLLGICVLFGALLLSGGCTVADDYHIKGGTTHTRSYTSVAGAVNVGASAKIADAKTVAGDISVGTGADTGDLSSVAGSITVGENCRVNGTIKTVAGNIGIRRGCVISGNVNSTAGNIEVADSEIQGGVTQTGGNVAFVRSHVAGVVRIKYTRHDIDRPVQVDIGPGCDIRELVVEPKAGAVVRIHRTAKVGSIKGVEPEYYD